MNAAFDPGMNAQTESFLFSIIYCLHEPFEHSFVLVEQLEVVPIKKKYSSKPSFCH